jgi:hypothetical protein
LLQLARFVFRPLAFLDECAARYGDLFQLDLSGFGRVIIVSDPKAIMEIFAAGPDLVHGGDANLVFKAFLGERSVLLLDGPEHRRSTFRFPLLKIRNGRIAILAKRPLKWSVLRPMSSFKNGNISRGENEEMSIIDSKRLIPIAYLNNSIAWCLK